jgi:hypothetical protein
MKKGALKKILTLQNNFYPILGILFLFFLTPFHSKAQIKKEINQQFLSDTQFLANQKLKSEKNMAFADSVLELEELKQAEYAKKLGTRGLIGEGVDALKRAAKSVFQSDEEIAAAAAAEAKLDKAEDERDAKIAAVQKEIDAQQALADKKEEEAETLSDTVEEQEEKEKEDEIANKKSALSNNLAKIDVLPKPEITSLPAAAIGDITSIDVLKENFAIYCLNDEPFFDRMKNDAFSAKRGTGTLSHPLPIKYNFKIMGTSGIRRGDTFNVFGIPEKYRKHGLFQVTQVEQSLEGMAWTTDVTGEYRQRN